MTNEKRYRNLKNVPLDIKRALVEIARENDVSVSDVVARTLCDNYGVRFESSGRRFTDAGDSDQLVVAIPGAVHAYLWRDAHKSGVTESSFALAIIAKRYGIDYVPVKRGRRRSHV